MKYVKTNEEFLKLKDTEFDKSDKNLNEMRLGWIERKDMNNFEEPEAEYEDEEPIDDDDIIEDDEDDDEDDTIMGNHFRRNY